MSKPRILVLTVGFTIGGAEKVIFDISKALKAKFDFTVVALREDGPLRMKIDKEGIRTVSLNGKSALDFRIFYTLNSFVKKIKPHIIHSHLFKANWIGRIIAHRNKIPQISTIHNLSAFLNPIELLFERYTSSLATVNIYCSKYVANDSFYRISHSDNYYIYNGTITGTPLIHRNIIPYNLLSICRIDLSQKALLELIVAINILKKRGFNFALDIYGDGPGINKLNKKIRKLALDNVVFLKGFIDNPLEVMKHYSVFVLPSKIEGLPVSILEAISSGLVVVASNVGGIPEIIDDEETGFLINGYAPQNIVDALCRVVSKVTDLPRIVSNALHKLEVSFNLKQAVSYWESLYRHILKNKSSRGLQDIIPHV